MLFRGQYYILLLFAFFTHSLDAQVNTFDAIKDVTVSCHEIPSIPSGLSNFEMDEMLVKGKCEDNYVIVRTWRGKNKNGKTITKTQKITVEDNEAPVITSKLSNITIKKGEEIPSVYVTGIPIAKDNCDAFLSMVYDEQVKVKKNQYERITRTWKVMDNCGNYTTFSQNITVLDNKEELTVSVK